MIRKIHRPSLTGIVAMLTLSVLSVGCGFKGPLYLPPPKPTAPAPAPAPVAPTAVPEATVPEATAPKATVPEATASTAVPVTKTAPASTPNNPK